MRPIRIALGLALLAGGLVPGCAGSFDPKPVEQVAFLQRQQSQERDGIRVSVAVPSADETRELFDENLYGRKVQPVWIEIENTRDEGAMFLPVGLDPAYYSPVEAANLGAKDADFDRERVRHFFDASLDIWLPPGEKRSGFVFTNLDEGTKAFNVDLVTQSEFVTFTFFVPVPGLKIDHHEVDWQHLYPSEEIVEVDDATLLAAIERQPCCATGAEGEGTADPLNLVVIGTPLEVYYAFLRAGWDETEVVSRSSLWKTVASFLTGGEYRYSPVSSLYAFGRKQDVAMQKARENIHERNHLRLWMSRARYAGKPVWIGQISRDIGVRFAKKTITTHKIDPDVDEAREYLLEDLAYAQSLAAFGYAPGVGAAPESAPRANLTGDPWFSDGYRLVLWLSGEPVDIADLEFIEWARPPHQLAPGGAAPMDEAPASEAPAPSWD